MTDRTIIRPVRKISIAALQKKSLKVPAIRHCLISISYPGSGQLDLEDAITDLKASLANQIYCLMGYQLWGGTF